jgi:aminoglycoside 6'-N-acetyltransferase
MVGCADVRMCGCANVSSVRVRLRPAQGSDAALLRRWDEAPHLADSQGDDDWQWETDLGVPRQGREQLVAELDGRPIGYVEILDPATDPERYWGEMPPGYRAIDIWIGEPDAVGRGFGTEMMRQALERCFSDASVHTVLVDPLASNTRAHRFYERLGFRLVERRFFGEDDSFVYQLLRSA